MTRSFFGSRVDETSQPSVCSNGFAKIRIRHFHLIRKET